MKLLGLNDGGYCGETIDIESVLADCVAAAEAHGWSVHWLETENNIRLLTLHRVPETANHKIYLSSGIHGDEPAAPLAVRELITENVWPEDAEIWVCPCLNPTGFPINTRENAKGDDLNRDYIHLNTPEIRAHTQWLQTLPALDFTIQLHEDWEAKGFYFYELKMDDRQTEPRWVLESVKSVCPIDKSAEIDGRRNDRGLIVPEMDPRLRDLWPEAFWLVMNKTKLSYTCEAPSDFPMETRVETLERAVRSLLASPA